MMHNKKIILSLTVGLLFSGIALYITFKNIPLRDLMGYLKTINYWWAIPSIAITLISFLIRVIRWQLILAPVKNTGFWSAFHPLMTGFMLNYILPWRVGEVARPAIFSKKEGVPFSKVLATVGAERVFDVVTLLLLFIIVFTTVEISPALDITFGEYHLNMATLEMVWATTLNVCFVLIAGIILISLRKTRRIIDRIILRLPDLLFFAGKPLRQKLRERFCLKLTHIIDNFASGFEMLKNPKSVGLCLCLSFFVWALVGLAFYVMAFGCPGITLSFLEMCAVMVILCFFIMLPSAPGFWGLFEAGGVFGLLLFGISAKEAAGFTLSNHVFQMIPVIIVGLGSAVITGVNIVQATHIVGKNLDSLR